MKKSQLLSRVIVVLSGVISLGVARADVYEVGAEVAAFKAMDQHKVEFQLKAKEVDHLLVTHDMETGKLANAALTERGAEFLGKEKAVYVANIHGMPGVGRMFALPKMRKYAHRIILCDDAELIARFPEEKGKVTVLGLKQGKVKTIRYWDPADKAALLELLK